MDLTAAALRLKRLTDAATEPVLTDDVVMDLLNDVRLPDSAGIMPDEEDWVPTYDLYKAVAEGWAIKAARVANDFTFAIDGQSFSRGQLYSHFLSEEMKYRKRSQAGLGTIELQH